MQSILSCLLTQPSQQLDGEQLDNTGPNSSPVFSVMKGHCPQTVKLILNICTFDICFILVLPLEVQTAILGKKAEQQHHTTTYHSNIVSDTQQKPLRMLDIHNWLPQYFWLWENISCPNLYTGRHTHTHTHIH